MKYRVSFEIRIPDKLKATKTQVNEWIKYIFGYSGEMDDQNPLKKEKFDPKYGTFVIEVIKE